MDRRGYWRLNFGYWSSGGKGIMLIDLSNKEALKDIGG
jgi:hypothetical protein